MIASMLAFAIADTLVKLSTKTASSAQVMFLLIGGALILFAAMALAQGNRLNDRRAFSPILLVRYLAEVCGMIGMVTALALVPLSVVGAVTQASPLLATVGAVVFLKETVGWRRWSSIIVGFLGVLIIIEPGGETFDNSVLWAILALVSLSVRDLTTRLIPSDMPSASLATYTMMAALPFTVAWILINGDTLLPEQTNWLIVIPMVVLGAAGYMLLISSIRISEVSIVMPFRYSRILFLLVLGIWLFDERPTPSMLLGAGLIIASGTYMMWREQTTKKQT